MPVVDWDGRPERPDVDGFHWVLTPDGEEAPYLWRSAGECERGHWPDGWIYAANEWNPIDCTYLGPCPTPDQLAAAVQAERAECAATVRKFSRFSPEQAKDFADSPMLAAKAIERRGDTSALAAALAVAHHKGWLLGRQQLTDDMLPKIKETAAALAKVRAEGMEAAAVWHEEQAAINATAGSPTSSANHSRYAAAIRARIEQGGVAK